MRVPQHSIFKALFASAAWGGGSFFVYRLPCTSRFMELVVDGRRRTDSRYYYLLASLNRTCAAISWSPASKYHTAHSGRVSGLAPSVFGLRELRLRHMVFKFSAVREVKVAPRTTETLDGQHVSRTAQNVRSRTEVLPIDQSDGESVSRNLNNNALFLE